MSNINPVVSVVMATYIKDNIDHLRLAVDSIKSQTFSCFELIIVVDGPVARESELYLLELSSCVNNKIIFLEKNCGPAKARNRGVEAARGKYIAIMDSDDISEPNRLEMQVDFIERNHADFISTWLKVIDNHGKCLGVRRLPLLNNGIKFLSVLRCPMHNPSILCLSDILKSHKYDESLLVSEDYDLWVRLLAAGYGALNMPSCLVKYRQDSASLHKRVGVRYFKADFSVKLKTLGFVPLLARPAVFVLILLASLPRLLPLSVFKYLYAIKEKVF